MEFELPDVLKNAPGMRAAELLIDGLSVLYFNKANGEKLWKVCFPRQREHDLTITTQQLDRTGKPVGRKDLHPINREVKTFTISLTNGSLEHYEPNHFPEGGPKTLGEFNRDNPNNNRHDLRWMIDLAGNEIGHGNFLEFLPRDGHLRSVASIRHSLFCNLKPERRPARISPRGLNHPGASGSRRLGRTNTFIVGVLLATTDGKIQFDFDPPLITIPSLDYNEDTRYLIKIINNDTRDAHEVDHFVRGDLGLFYDELIRVSGEEKDLWAELGPDVSADGDCHPTIFGGERFEP